MRPWLLYDNAVLTIAGRLGADGCTGVSELFLIPCLEHDIHYRTHEDLEHMPITKSEADIRFLKGMQSRSIVGKLSPIAWARYIGVRLFGRHAWKQGGKQ